MRPLLCVLVVVLSNAVPACKGARTTEPATPRAAIVRNAVASGGDTSKQSLDARYFDANLPVDDVFERKNPGAVGVDVRAVDALLEGAVQQASESVVVAVGRTIVVERYFGHAPAVVTVQSITKSVVSLEVGILLERGKLPSVDVPVSTYFPEWAEPPKSEVTLRHLLSHTSGLDDEGSTMFGEKDMLAYARTRPLASTPGKTYSYSNVGSMLLAGIVQRATGRDVEELVGEDLFAPLGITAWSWEKDAAGNVATPGGLQLAPRDLLRLAKLVADRGVWNGRALVPSRWLLTSTSTAISANPCYGLHWWLLREGCNSEVGYMEAPGPIRGAVADGWGGNYAVAIPDAGIVGVRTKTPAPNLTFEEEKKTSFVRFPEALLSLAPARDRDARRVR